MFYVYMQTYRSRNLGVYMLTHRHKTEKRIELVVTLYVYIRLYKLKTGPSSFGGRKNFTGQTVAEKVVVSR